MKPRLMLLSAARMLKNHSATYWLRQQQPQRAPPAALPSTRHKSHLDNQIMMPASVFSQNQDDHHGFSATHVGEIIARPGRIRKHLFSVCSANSHHHYYYYYTMFVPAASEIIKILEKKISRAQWQRLAWGKIQHHG